MIWCFLWKHHFSPFRIFHGLEEVNHLSRWWFQLQIFFVEFSTFAGNDPLWLVFFFQICGPVGSKYNQTESCPNFASSAFQIATQDKTLRPSPRSSVVLTTSSISCVLDLWEIGYGTLVVLVWIGASTAAISKTTGGNPWKESFPWRPTCCSFPVNAVACVLGHVHTGIAWFWQFESIFY